MTTFNDLAKTTSLMQIKVSIDRRTGDKTFEGSWLEVDSKRFISYGDLVNTVNNESETGSYITNESLNISVNNSDGFFNNEDVVGSYWYDTTTQYYIHNSKIKIDIGYEEIDGSFVWNANPFFQGVINYRESTYTAANMATLLLQDYLSVLDGEFLSDIFITQFSECSSVGVAWKILHKFVADWSAFGLTFAGVSLKSNYLITGLKLFTQSKLSLLEDIIKNTGSQLMLDKAGNVYINYFSYVPITAAEPFQNVTGTAGLWLFNNDNTDSSGFGQDLAGGGTYTTDAIFDYAWKADAYAYNLALSEIDTTESYTVEVLMQFNHFYGLQTLDSRIFILKNESSGTETFSFGITKNQEIIIAINEVSVDTGILVGQQTYSYFAFTMDKAAGVVSMFIDGIKVWSGNFANVGTSASQGIRLPAGTALNSWYYNSIRISNVLKTDAEIFEQTNPLYGSNINKAVSIVSVSEREDGVELLNYDSGIDKVYNKMTYTGNGVLAGYADLIIYGAPTVFPNSNVKIYYNTDTYASEVFRYNTEWFDVAGLIAAINNNANMISNNIYAMEIFGQANQVVRIINGSASWPKSEVDCYYWNAEWNLNFPFATGDTGIYLPFIIEATNDTSIMKIGVSPFTVETKFDLLNANVIQTTIDNVINEKSITRPVGTMDAPFWFNQLGLRDRINLTIYETTKNNGLLDDMILKNLPSAEAGGLGWTLKEFEIIGYNHSIDKNKTTYNLQEVV